MIRCANCGYEVDEVDQDTNFCQTCQKAYDRGFTDGAKDGSCESCGSYFANDRQIAGDTQLLCDECYKEILEDMEGENK
jgi:formylmethanofuran dehydrogenase subunit E